MNEIFITIKSSHNILYMIALTVMEYIVYMSVKYVLKF